MTATHKARFFGWLSLALGAYWLVMSLDGAGAAPGSALCRLGLPAALGSVLCLAVAVLAVGRAVPTARRERARSALILLVLAQGAWTLAMLVQSFVEMGAGVRQPCLGVALILLGAVAVWLGLSMLMGWLEP